MAVHGVCTMISTLVLLLSTSLLFASVSGFVVHPISVIGNQFHGQPTSPLDRFLELSETRDDSTTDPTTERNATVFVEGIGGKGGVVYDVNRLKRNLLQETMTAYKEELWELLANGGDAEIVEKLQALVQASPVRTTTDSNLLDGAIDWVLAYRSQYPTTVSSLVLYQGESAANGFSSGATAANYNPRYAFLWNQTSVLGDTKGSAKNKKNFVQRSVVLNKVREAFVSKRRRFRLEDLDDDDDAFVVDTTLIFGLLGKTKLYSLEGLTRSSLSLQKVYSRWSLMGTGQPKHHHREVSSKSPSGGVKTVQIVYLDNDLCILTEEDGPDSPFMVYTRNKAYVNSYMSMKRKIKVLTGALLSLVTLPVRIATLGREKKKIFYGPAPIDDPVLKGIIKTDATSNAVKLRVLRLGNINDEDEDESWESESDPFVHLSADERQEILKTMSVEQVERAADTYRSRTLRFRWLRKMLGRRKTSFKRPPENYKRPKK